MIDRVKPPSPELIRAAINTAKLAVFTLGIRVIVSDQPWDLSPLQTLALVLLIGVPLGLWGLNWAWHRAAARGNGYAQQHYLPALAQQLEAEHALWSRQCVQTHALLSQYGKTLDQRRDHAVMALSLTGWAQYGPREAEALARRLKIEELGLSLDPANPYMGVSGTLTRTGPTTGETSE